MIKRLCISLVLSLFLAAGAVAQGVTVLVLTPSDTQAVKAAHDKLVTAQKEFDALRNSLALKYQKGANYPAGGEYWQFSTDFRALVPLWLHKSSDACSYQTTFPLIYLTVDIIDAIAK